MTEEQIAQQIEYLRSSMSVHNETYTVLMDAVEKYGSHPFDILCIAAINRSKHITIDFCDFVDSNRLQCAAPLVRMQLDSALSLHGGSLADDLEAYATTVLATGRTDRARGKDGKRLKSYTLKTSLQQAVPFTENAHESTSDFIHLSWAHIKGVMDDVRPQDQGPPNMTLGYGPVDKDRDEEYYGELSWAFAAYTNVVLSFVRDWVDRKTVLALQVGPSENRWVGKGEICPPAPIRNLYIPEYVVVKCPTTPEPVGVATLTREGENIGASVSIPVELRGASDELRATVQIEPLPLYQRYIGRPERGIVSIQIPAVEMIDEGRL